MNLTRRSLEGTIETLKEDLEKDWAVRDPAWAAGLARELASWLRAFADEHDPPIREGEPIYSDGGVLKRKLPDGTMVAVNVAPVPLPLQIMACTCQCTGIAYSDKRGYCRKTWQDDDGIHLCACRCHPENR